MKKKFAKAREFIGNLLKGLTGSGGGNIGTRVRQGAVRAVGVVLTLCLFAGCTTTRSISFTGAQPTGELKYVTLTASVDESVLQRFYAKYPSADYQVVSCELVSKDYLPVVGALGGGLVGALLGALVDALIRGNVVFIVSGAGGMGLGYLMGNIVKDHYVITYVEKGGK